MLRATRYGIVRTDRLGHGKWMDRGEQTLSVDLQDLARRLFKMAETLWTNTELRPDQYAQPVLALIALRQMEARFDVVDAELPRGGRLGNPTPPDYHARGAIFLPPHARFSYLLGLPETENLAEA